MGGISPYRGSPRQMQVAILGGTAERHGWLALRGEGDEADALAELHEVSADPDVLTEAASRYVPDEPTSLEVAAAELLSAAGGDLARARQLYAERRARPRFDLGAMADGIPEASRPD